MLGAGKQPIGSVTIFIVGHYLHKQIKYFWPGLLAGVVCCVCCPPLRSIHRSRSWPAPPPPAAAAAPPPGAPGRGWAGQGAGERWGEVRSLLQCHIYNQDKCCVDAKPKQKQ